MHEINWTSLNPADFPVELPTRPLRVPRSAKAGGRKVFNPDLGTALLEEETITLAQFEEALNHQQSTGKPLDQCLLELNHLSEETLLKALSHHFNLPWQRLNGTQVAQDVLSCVPLEIVQEHTCMPIGQENGFLTLALSDPTETDAIQEVQFSTGYQVRPVLCSRRELLKTIEKSYDITVERLLAGMAPGDDDFDSPTEEYFIHDLEEKAAEPTLINLVNLIISQGIQEGASDIHIEPFEREVKVKYRIDGILQETAPPPKHLQAAISSRIKIMAGMDIAKRHEPQDGHIRINLPNAQVDIRVSSLPTVFGESIVMRLLNKSATRVSLEELGFSPDNYNRYTQLLDRSYGIILVTGPTGSGKSTTLYATLNKIYTPEKKIITIEDPVEYQMDGINQIPVREARGMTFASGLRAILRQDPDILMVGEIRDLETAEIAIRGALTGHLIFSTLHTNDAASAVTRLIDMGVEPFLIASSLQGVVAQRLVRRLCPACKEPFTPDSSLLNQFGKTEKDVEGITFYKAVGCEACRNRGYSGRIAVSELLLMNDDLQRAVLNRESSITIKNIARSRMCTMRESGWEKICKGIASFDDVLRTTQLDGFED